VYNELADLGFGSRELRTLLDKIINIAKTNDIDPWSAVKNYLKT
jgi:hypothetical protein